MRKLRNIDQFLQKKPFSFHSFRLSDLSGKKNPEELLLDSKIEGVNSYGFYNSFGIYRV